MHEVVLVAVILGSVFIFISVFTASLFITISALGDVSKCHLFHVLCNPSNYGDSDSFRFTDGPKTEKVNNFGLIF